MPKTISQTTINGAVKTELAGTQRIGQSPSDLQPKTNDKHVANIGIKRESNEKIARDAPRAEPEAIKEVLPAARPSTRRTKPNTTKKDMIVGLLRRKQGATLAVLQRAVGWQPHSVRAVLSGIRKSGTTVIRQTNKAGESVYKIDAG